MKRITLALAILLAVVSAACGLFAYLWIDRSVSLTYATQSSEITNSSAVQLRWLLENEWKGRPRAEISEKLRMVSETRAKGQVVIKDELNSIWFDEEQFNFVNGRLATIGKN